MLEREGQWDKMGENGGHAIVAGICKQGVTDLNDIGFIYF